MKYLMVDGELEDAEKYFCHAVSIYEKLVVGQPFVYKKDLLYTLSNQITVSELQGKDGNRYRERLELS